MKKLFTFVMALMATFSLNAADYYFVGAANGWSNGNENYKFTEQSGVLTLQIDSLCGDFKLIEGTGWHPQFGSYGTKTSDSVAATLPQLELNKAYTLVKETVDGSDPQNVTIKLADKHYYRNAVLTLDVTNADAPVITLISGTDVDNSAKPVTYQIVGGFTNWSTSDAIAFEDVSGVLTATVPDLNGTFKIIEDRSWDMQYATNWDTKAGLEFNKPYVLGAKGAKGEPANLALANPFAGYKNATLTLTDDTDGNKVLTLTAGTYYVVENDWFLPSTKLGWNCDDVTRFTPVAGEENTYELLLAEFKGDFKVVYGKWAAEFGQTDDNATWTINQEYTCKLGGGNVQATDTATTYTDVTVTLVVDYENAIVKVTLSSELTPTENIAIEETKKATKLVENGQMFIIKNGVRYNALGAVVE